MNQSRGTYREQVWASASLLNAPAQEQEAHLRLLGVYPSADELALEFHELALLAPAKVRAGELTLAEQLAVERLDIELGQMSGPEKAELWNAERLRTAPEWAAVRRLAAHTMSTIQDQQGSQR